MEDVVHIVSWSGGKDSTASVILAHENGEPVDLILMCVVWFDKARGIYGENPEHLEWVFNYAKPVFEAWGYKVKIITSEKDYIHYFYKIRKKSKNPEYVGKYYGWLLGGMCKMNEEKIGPIRKYIRNISCDCEEYVGIAIDEPERLKSLKSKKGKVSLLERYAYTENDAKLLCEKYNLLSPVYGISKRGGCWFCPNQGIKELANLKTKHYELWKELETLSGEKNTVSVGFKYGKTFDEISNEVECYIQNDEMQLSLFDL